MPANPSYTVYAPGPMQWPALESYLQNYLQQDQPINAFTAALPNIVYNAELRIYRELDFLNTRQQNATLAFTAGARTLDLSAMTGTMNVPTYPVVIQRLAAITPTGSMPANGTRVQFLETSLDFLDFIWPNASQTLAPSPGFAYWAPVSATLVAVAPTPDQAYAAEVTGTWRPAPMSTTNPETWLGDNLPDLLFAACMVEGTGWIRDYGQQSDDPRFALSWEQNYQLHKASALEEEQRRKGYDPGWQPYSPAPLAAQVPPGGAMVKGR